MLNENNVLSDLEWEIVDNTTFPLPHPYKWAIEQLIVQFLKGR